MELFVVSDLLCLMDNPLVQFFRKSCHNVVSCDGSQARYPVVSSSLFQQTIDPFIVNSYRSLWSLDMW